MIKYTFLIVLLFSIFSFQQQSEVEIAYDKIRANAANKIFSAYPSAIPRDDLKVLYDVATPYGPLHYEINFWDINNEYDTVVETIVKLGAMMKSGGFMMIHNRDRDRRLRKDNLYEFLHEFTIQNTGSAMMLMSGSEIIDFYGTNYTSFPLFKMMYKTLESIGKHTFENELSSYSPIENPSPTYFADWMREHLSFSVVVPGQQIPQDLIDKINTFFDSRFMVNTMYLMVPPPKPNKPIIEEIKIRKNTARCTFANLLFNNGGYAVNFLKSMVGVEQTHSAMMKQFMCEES